MNISIIFETALAIAGVVLGLRIVTEPGKIGYFLRKPFVNLDGWKHYIMRPIILCSVCMCSIWGTIVFVCLHLELVKAFILDPQISNPVIWYWWFSILTAAFISGILFEVYQLIELARSRLDTFWMDKVRLLEPFKTYAVGDSIKIKGKIYDAVDKEGCLVFIEREKKRVKK